MIFDQSEHVGDIPLSVESSETTLNARQARLTGQLHLTSELCMHDS